MEDLQIKPCFGQNLYFFQKLKCFLKELGYKGPTWGYNLKIWVRGVNYDITMTI